jgi:hypothetical protein
MREEVMVHDRKEVIRHIHRLAHAVACGQAPFPVGNETTASILLMAREAGLLKEVPPDEELPELPEGRFCFTLDPSIERLLMILGFYPLAILDFEDVSDEDRERVEDAPSLADSLELLREIAARTYWKMFARAP